MKTKLQTQIITEIERETTYRLNCGEDENRSFAICKECSGYALTISEAIQISDSFRSLFNAFLRENGIHTFQNSSGQIFVCAETLLIKIDKEKKR